MNLYELPDKYREMLDLLDESDDEGLTEAVDNALLEIKHDLKNHAEYLGKALSIIDSQNVSISHEIDRLKALLTSRKKRYDAIKNGVRRAMILMDQWKIETDLCTFSLRKGLEVVEILNEEALPDEYMNVEVVTKPLKAEIKKAIKAGELDESIARLNRNEPTLNIK